MAAENIASQVSIVHTAEAMQMAVEDFSEHIDHCNVSFKQAIMEKVKALKQTDETILTERVSSQDGREIKRSGPSNIHHLNSPQKLD